MIEDAPRCPRCGKRRTDGAPVCACGFEFLPHRERIRCNHCGQRIPADMPECPRCGADPRGRYLPIPGLSLRLVRTVAVAVGLVLMICLGWVVFRALSTNVIARVLGLEPTPQPTQAVQVLYVVATPVPPTPTPIPTATLVPTAAPSATPTRRGARAVTSTPAPPTPVRVLYAAPQLLGPANTTVYSGATANIVLEWRPVSPSGLGENEWYRVWISYTGRDGKPAEQARWTKESHWTVPTDWWKETFSDIRLYSWNVTVVRFDGINPFGSSNYIPSSPTSSTRSFFWN